MYKTAFNTTEQPVAIDTAGRRIGGRDWDPVNTTDPVAKAALDAGVLVLIERPDGDDPIDPRALAAFERTETMAALAELPADEVKEIAEDAGLEADTKAEAVEKVGRSKGAR